MSLVTVATNVIERVPIPDAITSAGISFLVDRTRHRLSSEKLADRIRRMTA